jgi:hypothetical protein
MGARHQLFRVGRTQPETEVAAAMQLCISGGVAGRQKNISIFLLCKNGSVRD